MKKKPLTQEQLAECAAAHSLYLRKKNELKLSQRKIAESAGITAPAVNLYFKGINALNLSFAMVLSDVLGEPVSTFSPRLAKEMQKIQGSTGGAAKAPPLHLQLIETLQGRATPTSREILLRLAKAAETGRLTEDDLRLLDQIASRIERNARDNE